MIVLFLAWMYIGLIGAFCFILVQLILLVDFAHSWNETWVNNMEESGNKIWFFALASFTCIMYATSIAGIVCMFVYFTQSSIHSCPIEKFIISFQLVLSVLTSILAISPTVQERQPKSGMYFTFLFAFFMFNTSSMLNIGITLSICIPLSIDITFSIDITLSISIMRSVGRMLSVQLR